MCEEALLKIKGVISFTFQMAVKRCIVRIRSDLKAEVRPDHAPSWFSLYNHVIAASCFCSFVEVFVSFSVNQLLKCEFQEHFDARL